MTMYLPSGRQLRHFVYSALASWLIWFLFLGGLSCAEGCSSTTWSWMLAECLLFGASFAGFVWALAASVECILAPFGKRSQFTWVGRWPQAAGVAVIAWSVHILSLLGCQLLFHAVGTPGPFGNWFFGFIPLLSQ